MSDSSKIEWTDATWNPVTGCTQVSPGCDNCYAMRFAERWRGIKGHYFQNGFDVVLRAKMLDKPNQWRKPRLIFVNSMSDLFHRDVPDKYIDRVFERMEATDRHVYQLLTKRPERMKRYLGKRYGQGACPPHIWIGTSVESNAYAWRAETLRNIRAEVRFLSVEPMLGPVGGVKLEGIGWVIAGGESGPGFRPLHVQWVRDLRDRCVAGNIAFFFKQWHKGKTGRLLDGCTWDEMPLVA